MEDYLRFQSFLRSESMKFPHAAKGVKKLFTAEVLYLISVILIGVGTIFALTSGGNVSGATAMLLATSVSIGGILAIIALVMQIIGVIQAAKDEASFRGVIYVTLFSIAVSIVASIFAAIFRTNTFLTSISNVVSAVVSVITTVLIILGISNLMSQLGKEDLAAKGTKILRIVVWLAVLSVIMRFIGIFLPKDINDARPLAKVIILCLSILAVVLEIVEYVLYISLLSKASKALNE